LLLFISAVLFFFFQAEDGIRYRNVTGVQTCALPIYMLFTRDGLAQATRLPVAAHHARRLIGQAAPADTAEADGSAPAPDGETPLRIADLGCGIGADSIAFSGMGAQVTAVDADEVTAAIAAFNLRHLPDASVEHARAEDVD